MKVFVTGATGFIGSAIVRELLADGHQVLGMVRSDAAAAALAAIGAEVHRGSLDDLDSLRSGAAATEGVIHTAYNHDFSDMAAAAQTDRRAIETLGEALAGSDRPFVSAFGVALLSPGRTATEDLAPDSTLHPRAASEQVALAFAERGVRTSIVRLPPTVHGEGDHGFMARLIAIAREKGVSAYPNDGANHWPAVHRLDAGHLFRLGLENAPAGTRLHAIADEGVPVRDIAAIIGRHLNLPVVSVSGNEIGQHFGWLGAFFSLDILASSALTRQRLGWQPSQPGLLADLDQGHYFKNG